jgi:predicted dinucleotide-binding enzyme
MEEATAALAHELDGKVVIDATNSLGGQVMNRVAVQAEGGHQHAWGDLVAV